MMDVWSLIGGHLDIKDLPSFLRTSKQHARMSEREDLWKSICYRHYGDWELASFSCDSWKQIVKLIYQRRLEYIRGLNLNDLVIDHPARKIAESHLNQLYVKSSNKITICYETKMNFQYIHRLGDMVITWKPGLFAWGFKHFDRISTYPPLEFCWPNKSIEYCRILKRIYINISEDHFK